MKIKYVVDNIIVRGQVVNQYCLTKCPFNMILINTIMVGSAACKSCNFHSSDNEEKRIVTCTNRK